MKNTWAIRLLTYWRPFKMSNRGIQTNGPKSKAIDTCAPGFTYKRWHRRDKMKTRIDQHWGLRWCINARNRAQYYENQRKKIIVATSTSDEILTIDWKNKKKSRYQKWEEKLCIHFKGQTWEIVYENTWTWPRNENLYKETESLLISAIIAP